MTASPTASARERLKALREEIAARGAGIPARVEASAAPGPGVGRRIRRGLLRFLGLVALLVVPFLAFVRAAVWMHADGHTPWFALVSAALICAVLLTAAGARVSHALGVRLRVRSIATRIVAPVVILYCGYTLFHLSGLNAKTPAVRQYYDSVHPVLRVAIGTVVLVDREIVVTDTRRVPADYARMGLPVYGRSLHFEQDNGWVHAVDLRTIGRAGWKNLLMTWYFRVMGFRTLRHVGTADHLHVSLPACC